MVQQSTSHLLMIRPVKFRLNEQTAVNNYYQKAIEGLTSDEIQAKALNEFDSFVEKLRANGVDVTVVDDTEEPDTPDSIFPNNWVSFHADGRVGLYPMFAPNRRLERRIEILDMLQREYGFDVDKIEDFSRYEDEDLFLEGTGSIILDRPNKIAYAAKSVRTDEKVLKDFCDRFGYEPVVFEAKQTVDKQRLPIYHTNVMMCVADDFAILCADSIDDQSERKMVIESLEKTGKEVIDITEHQKHHFAGNMLNVRSEEGQKYLVMSSAAFKALEKDQIDTIEKYCPTIHSSLDIIEAIGGGSARCMMAEIFLPKE